jgi:hypothetical protein
MTQLLSSNVENVSGEQPKLVPLHFPSLDCKLLFDDQDVNSSSVHMFKRQHNRGVNRSELKAQSCLQHKRHTWSTVNPEL